ncbi:sulfite oxidase [Actinidia rufa]|uniref:Sulfite oxidase n=1 Tax=Actinidia rufa TaxID=165716 RepID=A0A7J0ENQ9_9ERIC|nr:sulfite oxidase [Actinidia rufa]
MKSLLVNELVAPEDGVFLTTEPFNAEPPRISLISSYLTPVDFFYERNHGPVPVVDDIQSYRLAIGGLVEKPLELSLVDIKKLPKYDVTATLQSAGNRRTAMRKIKAVKRFGWDVSAIGNGMPFASTLLTAIWGGAKLADVLELVGIPKSTRTTSSGEENGGPYKSSISLTHVTNPEADVLLAYEMNEEVLILLNGWVQSTYSQKNARAFSCKGTTRCFLPPLNGKISTGPLVSHKWIFQSSAICSLEDVDTVQHGKITVNGYVVSGGGCGIERVNVSIDGSKTRVEASRYQNIGIPYAADAADDDIENDKWAWVFFKAKGDVFQNTDIVSKAISIC